MIKADNFVNGIATKWARPRVNTAPVQDITGMLRGIAPIAERPGSAYVCLNDNTNLLIVEMHDTRWKFFDRRFGNNVTIYVDDNGDWTHTPPAAAESCQDWAPE